METMQQVIAQEMIEKRYNRKHIDGMLKDALEADSEAMVKVAQGAELVDAFVHTEHSYASKNVRLASLKGMDMHSLVFEMVVACMYFVRPEKISSAAAQVACHLNFDDKVAAVQTVAELLAVLCEVDLFDITKADRQDSLYVVSRIELPEELLAFVSNSRYLPPMVCEPLELTDNYSSGYLTHKDGLVLGKGNNHAGDLCLDVLNTLNKVKLSLNTEFISTVEEEPTFELDKPEKAENWKNFKRESYEIYTLLNDAGNCFYLTWKMDMRGRMYSQGYHCNVQGVAHKKACIDLYDKQVIDGVPPEFQL